MRGGGGPKDFICTLTTVGNWSKHSCLGEELDWNTEVTPTWRNANDSRNDHRIPFVELRIVGLHKCISWKLCGVRIGEREGWKDIYKTTPELMIWKRDSRVRPKILSNSTNSGKRASRNTRWSQITSTARSLWSYDAGRSAKMSCLSSSCRDREPQISTAEVMWRIGLLFCYSQKINTPHRKNK